MHDKFGINLGLTILVTLPLRSKKAGRFEKLLGLARSHSIVTRSSRAPSYHTLPAFLNLNDIKIITQL